MTIPKPQAFRAGARAPKVERELLERIGVDDPEFVAWFRELDVMPLLQVALDRTRARVDSQGLRLELGAGGRLTIDAEYRDASERQRLADRSDRLLARWQFEVLAIVLQLLGYETRIGSGPALLLEAEKQGKEKVREYVSVTQAGGSTSRLRFEHFKSRDALQQEIRKFLALTHKCGLAVDVQERAESGQPIAEGQVHRDFLKGTQ